MSGISTGVGLISGINTGQLIEQLMSLEARPKALAQRRIVALQAQQAAFIDLGSKLGSLQSAAQAFRLNKVFQAATATSSNKDVLTATANAGATPGAYTFIVDRLATSQQLLSRSYADRAVSSLGLTSLVVDSDKARLDSRTDLSALNGGAGVSRGKVVVTDASGASATIDLSKAATVNDVLDALNSGSGVSISATVQDGNFVITDTSGGGGTFRIVSAGGYTTAESLGIAKTGVAGVITGNAVYTIGDNTSIQSLNDGNGIRFNTNVGTATPDFTVTTRDGSNFAVDLGDMYDAQSKKTAGQVNTFAEMRARIQSQTSNKVDLQVRPDGRGLRLVDLTAGGGNFVVTEDASSGAMSDLGLTEDAVAGTITGKTVLAGLGSVLASSLVGTSAIAAIAPISITTRAGGVFNFTIDGTQSISTILSAIQSGTGGAVTASLSERGNSIVLTDSTSGGGAFIVSGAGADALGVANGPGGTTSASINGSRVLRQYVTGSTLLATLNGGAGIGSGTFEITGATGNRGTVNISSAARTVDDVLKQINGTSSQTGVQARINDAGNGILIEVAPGVTNPQLISIKDTSGTVARSLNLVGAATDLGANFIDGSFRRSISLNAADTLDTVVTKVNAAKAGVSASIISDGNAVTPYRLKLGATQSGRAGRVIVESVGADLAFSNIGAGEDARVFVGADDPARAILVTRSSNSLSSVIDGVQVSLQSASANPVTLTIARDDESILKAVTALVDAFNTVTGKIKEATSYNSETKQRGTLLGDPATSSLQADLFLTVGRAAPGLTGRYTRLTQVGITVAGGGKLTLDSTKLKAALAEDPQAVTDLFAAQVKNDKPATVPVPGVPGASIQNTSSDTFSVLGLGEVLAQMVDKYTNASTGVFTGQGRALDSEIKLHNDRIAALDTRLAAKRKNLELKFARMEQALAQLQQQQGALGGLTSLSQ